MTPPLPESLNIVKHGPTFEIIEYAGLMWGFYPSLFPFEKSFCVFFCHLSGEWLKCDLTESQFWFTDVFSTGQRKKCILLNFKISSCSAIKSILIFILLRRRASSLFYFRFYFTLIFSFFLPLLAIIQSLSVTVPGSFPSAYQVGAKFLTGAQTWRIQIRIETGSEFKKKTH